MFWRKKAECCHEWKIVCKVVQKPVNCGLNLDYNTCGADLIVELTQGKTNIVMTCDLCGQAHTVSMFGVPE